MRRHIGLEPTPLRKAVRALTAVMAFAAPLLLGIMSPLRAQGQSAQSARDTQRFEVASVKPCDPQPVPPGGRSGGGNGSFSPGRAHLNCFIVRNLISTAHINNRAVKNEDDPLNHWSLRGLIGGQGEIVRGGPEWVYSEKYTIEAKADGLDPSQPRNADRAVMLGPMLRALLEDRFKLKVHQETEDVPMWALTVAKGGLKVKPIGPEGGCTTLDPANGRGPGMDEEIAMVRRGEKPICGHGIMGGKNGPNEALALGGRTMAGVAGALSTFTDRWIIDKTGIAGTFNLYLEFAADALANDKLFFMQRDPNAPAATPTAPSLVTALQEQWGLKLEPTRGPRGYIVIDHIERPAPDGPAPARATGAGKPK